MIAGTSNLKISIISSMTKPVKQPKKKASALVSHQAPPKVLQQLLGKIEKFEKQLVKVAVERKQKDKPKKKKSSEIVRGNDHPWGARYKLSQGAAAALQQCIFPDKVDLVCFPDATSRDRVVYFEKINFQITASATPSFMVLSDSFTPYLVFSDYFTTISTTGVNPNQAQIANDYTGVRCIGMRTCVRNTAAPTNQSSTLIAVPIRAGSFDNVAANLNTYAKCYKDRKSVV